MKNVLPCLVALSILASPALAQSKIDQALAKAEEQLAKGKPEDAIKTISKIVEQNPTSGEAQVALARLQERLGNLDEAVAALTKAKSMTTGAAKAEVLAALASMDLLRGTAKDALADAKQSVELAPTPSTLAALARAQARSMDAPNALLTADKAVAAGPSSALAHEARGVALAALGRNEDAAAAFRKALELDPKLSRARAWLATTLVALDKPAEAVTEARKATEADPKNGEAFAALGRALLAVNPKDWNAAIAEAQQGAFLNPKSPYVQLSVGKIFEAAGNYDQAALAYEHPQEAGGGDAGQRRGTASGRRADAPEERVHGRSTRAGDRDEADARLLHRLGAPRPGLQLQRAPRRGGERVQEGGGAGPHQHRIPDHPGVAARHGRTVRRRGGGAGARRGDPGLQGSGRLDQPGLGLPQHEAAQDHGIDRRLQEGPRDRPQGGAVGPGPGLGLLLHESVGRRDRRLQQGHPDRAQDRGRGLQRDRLVLLLQEGLRERQGLHGEGAGGRPKRRAPQGQHRARGEAVGRGQGRHRG